ncbi:MAG: delta-60 repeat domain-containing protein [Acidobacteriota bacterium]
MSNNQKSNRMLVHRKKLGVALIAFVLALLTAKPVWRALAAAGDLDTSFSGDGRFTPPALFSDIGYARNFPEVRIQADPNNPQVEKVIVPYSEKLPFSCYVGSDAYDFLVTRLTASGATDSTFGFNGAMAVSFAGLPGIVGGKGYISALELQSNGKILLAGQIETCTGYLVGLARLTFDGAMDTTFGTGGRIVLNGQAEVFDMAVSNGKILLVGRKQEWDGNSGTPWISAIWRFNADGTPDTTFSLDGVRTLSVWPDTSTNNGGPEGFKSVAVQPDGKIAVLNSTFSGSYRLRRFTSTGVFDNTLLVNAAAGEYGNTIRAGSSSIWVVGAKEQQGVKYGAIFSRNTSNGSVDTTYGGGDGMALSAQPSEWSEMASVPFSFPSKYVVAGWNTYPFLGELDYKAVITRLSGTGVLDTGFGTNGSVETVGFIYPGYSSDDFASPDSRYFSVRIGLSGKIVTAGQAGNFSFTAPPTEFGVVARYLGN